MTAQERQKEERAIFGYLMGVPGEMQVLNAVSSTGYTIAPITTTINMTGHTDIMAIPTTDLLKAIHSYKDEPAVKMRRIDAKYAHNCPTVDNYGQQNVKILLETGEGTWGTYTGDEPLYIAYVWNKEGRKTTIKNVCIAMERGKKRAKKRAGNEEEEIKLISYYAYQEMINLYRRNEAALTTGFILWELKGLQDIYHEMKAEKDKGIENDLILDKGYVLIPPARYLSKYGAVIYRYNEQAWNTETIGANSLQRPPAKAYDYVHLCEIDHYREWWQKVESKSNYDYIRYMRQDEHDKKAAEASSTYFREYSAIWWKIMNGDMKSAAELAEKLNKPIKEAIQERVAAFREENREMLTEYERLLSELGIPQKKITIGQMRKAREQAKRNIEAKKADKG